MRKPLPPVATLSRVIEPQAVRRPVARRPAARPSADQVAVVQAMTRPNADQVAVAQAMTRQATAVRTSTMQRTDAQLPTEQWYRVEDPYTTAENDAAFAAFMAGDNPHVRTDEVPVVDFTSMIEKVGPDGRPIEQSTGGGSRVKVLLVALATAAILAAAAAFGLIEIPGVGGDAPDAFGPSITSPSPDGSGD